jgi:hypothetical protein
VDFVAKIVAAFFEICVEAVAGGGWRKEAAMTFLGDLVGSAYGFVHVVNDVEDEVVWRFVNERKEALGGAWKEDNVVELGFAEELCEWLVVEAAIHAAQDDGVSVWNGFECAHDSFLCGGDRVVIEFDVLKFADEF